jgi:hypothetical protein
MIKYLTKKILSKRSILIVKLLYNRAKRSRIYFVRLINHSRDIYTNYQINALGENKHHSFFGYYDVSPFHSLTNEIIYLTLDKKERYASIVLEDLNSNEKKTLTTTQAWNWQQGCRLRWLRENSDEIIFNDFKNDRYYSRILNVRTGKEDKIDYPIYDINSQGTLGITLDFARLGVKRPGYGYTLTPYSEPNDLSAEGIYLVNIKKNTVSIILTYKEIAERLEIQHPQYPSYYLNHLSFFSSGNKFMFFFLDSSTVRHESYMLVYDLDEKYLHILESTMKVSHYVWEDNGHIIATSYDRQMNCRYYRYGMNKTKEAIMPNVLCLDGHPSIYKDGVFLTDTYPDKMGYQKLYFFNEKQQTITELAKIFSSFKFGGEKRTDLHPRFNKNKDKIAFDANIDGFRKVYYFNLI